MKRVEIVLDFDSDEIGLLTDIVVGLQNITGKDNSTYPKLEEEFFDEGILILSKNDDSMWKEFFKVFDENKTKFSTKQSFLISELREEMRKL